MPLYEYVCRTCHADFEVLTSASRRDTPDIPCPQCTGMKVARKVSLAARPIMKDGGREQPDFDCGALGGCCGGACNFEN